MNSNKLQRKMERALSLLEETEVRRPSQNNYHTKDCTEAGGLAPNPAKLELGQEAREASGKVSSHESRIHLPLAFICTNPHEMIAKFPIKGNPKT